LRWICNFVSDYKKRSAIIFFKVNKIKKKELIRLYPRCIGAYWRRIGVYRKHIGMYQRRIQDVSESIETYRGVSKTESVGQSELK
jgi:hypothetical protein